MHRLKDEMECGIELDLGDNVSCVNCLYNNVGLDIIYFDHILSGKNQ